MSGDICDWLAKEEEDAEQWGGMGGALFYREQFAAARNEIVRLRAEIERLDAENAVRRRNEWRLIWGLCTECGRNRDQEACRG